MIRITSKIVRLAIPVAALIVCMARTAIADVWQQNVSMLVQTDGKPDGAVSVFDSPDYQQLLMVLEGNPISYVLGLSDGGVFACPRDSVRTDAEGNARVGLFRMEYVSDLEKKGAMLAFQGDGHQFLLQPLPPLVGPATLQKVLELKPAYAHAAQAYKPDPAKVATLKAVTADTEIRVYFGTWCLLCKKLLPGLIRTTELAANPKIRVTYVGVDEDLKEPAADIARDHITKTPTILVLQNGVEMGRIEEKPGTTIEGDLATILAAKR